MKPFYSTVLAQFAATLIVAEWQRRNEKLRGILEEFEEQMQQRIQRFQAAVSPQAMFDLETGLSDDLRRLGRDLMEFALDGLEDSTEPLPRVVRYRGTRYRVVAGLSPRRHGVATLFGTIEFARLRYESVGKVCGSIFPLEIELGLVHGFTPALRDRAGQYMAEAGASQRSVLQRLKTCHDVDIGTARLLAVCTHTAAEFAAVRQALVVARILELLHQAYHSRGPHKPVLAVGRDGVTMPMKSSLEFRVASVATIAVYDRSGNRLGTVYLAHQPESMQPTTSQQLTAILRDVIRQWQLPDPRFCYVTDCGANETGYYFRTLRCLRDPRQPHRYIRWQRIVDFYHVMERLTIMGESLFGAGRRAQAWAKKQALILRDKPNGAFRVLHSAAALRARCKLSKERAKKFDTAYGYIRKRTRYMKYAEYKRQGLPISSGVTEAACKTIVTQRLKLSGMKWQLDGSCQTILTLRTIHMSRLWEQSRAATLAAHEPVQIETPDVINQRNLELAA
jgi:hypothetical protein